MEEIIGSIIQKIFIGKKNQNYLRFETDNGNFDYEAMGGCCSESYFSDINRIQNIIGAKVRGVKDIGLMPEEVSQISSRQKSDEIYGFRIITDKGEGRIIMRNSSNGYYGGWIAKIKEIPEEEMFEITKDFCVLDLIADKNDQN